MEKESTHTESELVQYPYILWKLYYKAYIHDETSVCSAEAPSEGTSSISRKFRPFSLGSLTSLVSLASPWFPFESYLILIYPLHHSKT